MKALEYKRLNLLLRVEIEVLLMSLPVKHQF